MKNPKINLLFFLLIFIVFSFQFNYSQSPDIQWQESFGGSSGEHPIDIQLTIDSGGVSGYIAAGYTFSSDGDVTGSQGLFDFWLVKTSLTGTMEWEKTFGGSGSEFAQSIIFTGDGVHVVAGYSNSNDGDVTNNNGSFDFWLVKFLGPGSLVWENNYGGSGLEQAFSITNLINHNNLVVGSSHSSDGDVGGNNGDGDFWIINIDQNGNLLWEENYGGSGHDVAKSVIETSDGGSIVAGFTTSNDFDVTGNHGGEDFWIIKLSNTGTLQWQKTFGGSEDDRAYSILQINNGDYIVSGYSFSNDGDVTGNHGSSDVWVIKLDNTGNLIWQKAFGGSGDDRSYDIAKTNNGGFVISGYTESNNGDVGNNYGFSDSWIIRIDDAGNLLWEKNMGGSESDTGFSIQQTLDGGYIVANDTFSNDNDVTQNNGDYDFWIVKLEEDPLSVIEFGSKKFSIYPNPASTNLTIEVEGFENNSDYKISILNILGQELYSNTIDTQKFSIILPKSFQTGVYYVTIQNLNGLDSFTKKLVIK